MKKISVCLLTILSFGKFTWASHLQGLNASNISFGTLDSTRLDASSITELGPLSKVNLISGNTNYATSLSSTNLLLVGGNTNYVSIGVSIPPRIYEVTIGTVGAVGVDFAGATTSVLDNALTFLNARGLSFCPPGGSTVQANILFVGGPFNMYNATCPCGITFSMIKGSSSTWMPVTETTGTILTVYGKLNNFKVDGSSQQGFTGYKVLLASGATVDGLSLVNFNDPSRPSEGNNALAIVKAASVTVNDLFMDNFAGVIESNNFGFGAAIHVDLSTGVYFNRPILKRYRGIGANFTAVNFSRSVDWHWIDGQSDKVFGDYFLVNGGNIHWEIARHRFHINGTYGANRGILPLLGQMTAFPGSSTGTITGNWFFHEPGGSNQAIISLVNGTGVPSGTVITGNWFINKSGGTPTAIEIQTGSLDTFLLYNFTEGMTSYTDAGTRTRVVQ